MKDEFMSGKGLTPKLMSAHETTTIISHYFKAKKRLVLLDYDGTLVPIASHHTLAVPDEKLLALLTMLSKNKKNQIVVISGRDKKTLTQWLGHLNITLVAEHSGWVRQNNKWQQRVQNSEPWKMHILPVLNLFAKELPGCLIEEKEFSVVWHYRNTDPKKSKIIAKELTDHLLQLSAPKNIKIMLGNEIIEVKDANIGKNFITQELVDAAKSDCIIAIGDDTTDEDMFGVLPPEAISIKVGVEGSCARFNVASQAAVIELLQLLANDE